MAEQKILISIQIQDKAAKKTIDATSSSLNKLATSQKKVAKATDNTRATSGLNNAILMETSRLASDASFGFTAIANNLSQLINLFKASKDATGSFMTSIKSLFTAQSALLIGIQLLITYGDDLYRLFKELVNGSQLLKETFKDAGSEVQGTAGSFEIYIKTLQDSNKSQEEQTDAINRLKKEFPEYLKQLDKAKVTLTDVANKTEEATKQNDLYRESITRLAMSRAAQNKIEELTSEKINLIIEQDLERIENAEKIKTQIVRNQSKERTLARLEEERDSGELTDAQLVNINTMISREEVRLNSGRERLADLKEVNREEIKEIDKQVDALIKFIDIENNERKKGGRKRERDFKQQLLDLSKLEESYRQKSIDQTLLTEDEKINEQEKFAKAELDIRLKQFKDRQKLRLDEFKESDASADEKLQAEKDYNESIELAEQEHNDVMIQLQASFDTKRKKLERNRAIRDADDRAKAFEAERLAIQKFNSDKLKFQEDYLKSYTDSEIDRVEVAKQIEQNRFQTEIDNLNLIRDIRIANGQSVIDIDQQILNAEAQNSQTKIALAEQERDAKIAIANQVGNAIVAVAGEGSTVGKAASVAMAIMNTREAFTAALGAKPYGVWNIAQATAVLAMGMKQVRDIMAVKIPGKDPSTGGGMTIEAPDFNVVGASQTSQLAEVVAGQQAKPIKAFVVGKDISTQQELDRNITNTASFG